MTTLSYKTPLVSGENAFNPDFLTTVFTTTSALFATLGLIQLVCLGKHKAIKGTSIIQHIKLGLILVYGLLVSIYYLQVHEILLMWNAITVLVVYLPLHLLEVRSSQVPHASALLFWSINSVLLAIITIQDAFSKHVVWPYGSWQFEILILSILVFIFESQFYTPLFLIDPNDPRDFSLFSTSTYSWVFPVMQQIRGNEDSKVEDLPLVAKQLTIDYTYSNWLSHWNRQLNKKPWFFNKNPQPLLVTSTIRANIGDLLVTMVCSLLDLALQVAQPLLLQQLLGFFQDYTMNGKDSRPQILKGVIISAGMYISATAQMFIENQESWASLKITQSVDSALTLAVFKKAMVLSPLASKNKPTGEIINHINVDIRAVQSLTEILPDLITTPLLLVFSTKFLIQMLGKGMIGGLVAAGLVTPLAALVSAGILPIYEDVMKKKDKRTSFTNEFLISIKSVKLFAWEKPMLDRLFALRNAELEGIKKFGIYVAAMLFVWECIPFFVNAGSYAAFTYMYDIPLTPEIVFPALAFFDQLSLLLMFIPNVLSGVVTAITSVRRISAYLLLDEIDPYQGGYYKHTNNPENAVVVKDATFMWSTKTEDIEYKDEETAVETPILNIALKDITFTAGKGKLICIVGKVGSGKTTLLRSILGELPLKLPEFSEEEIVTPSVEISGSIAFCPQSPWILNATVRENILFGHRYDPEVYQMTVDCCQLVSDFTTLADGDFTLVGEKGISLSGGQKARISLARAVYSRADIFIFDDILSAVDAHVGKAIVQKVLSPRGLIGDKTKILATNSVPILHLADQIYLLEEGTVSESGNFAEVTANNGKLAYLIREFGKVNQLEDYEVQSTSSTMEQTTLSSELAQDVELLVAENAAATDVTYAPSTIRPASIVSFDHKYDFEDAHDGQERTKVVEEFVATGAVKLHLLWEYCKACNYKYVIVYFVCGLLTSGIVLAEKYLLTYWSEINAVTGKTQRPFFYLSIYISLGIIQGFLILLESYVLWSLCIINGARFYHTKLAESISRAPMSFFETTPIGRILNRFTQDIDCIDLSLPWTFVSFVSSVLSFFVTVAVVVSTMPVMIIVLLGTSIAFIHCRNVYISAARQLERLSKTATSPVLATIQESINGVDTIRAFDRIPRFTHVSKKAIDSLVNTELTLSASRSWFYTRLRVTSCLVILGTTSLSIYSLTTSQPMNSALVGFLLTYAINTTSVLNELVSSLTEVETESVSVERLNEFSLLTSEAPLIIEEHRPLSTWPENGEIVFDNYSTKYREHLDPVLKGISLSIQSKEKIGIVGRTGAGKSSLALALFRIIEPCGGNIKIDGIDTSSIGLNDLRSKLNIIPQESQIIKGSVRQNLDPLEKHTDDQLWRVLDLAHLKTFIEQMKTEPPESEDSSEEMNIKAGLDAMLDEGGSNISAGQKQLLSLARSLLNESKVLVLDEATASVDVQTDKIIQSTIRSEFKGKTIITIAHRIDTIMDADKVLVLDKGEVKEYDAPQTLLKNKDSIFYSLCKLSGHTEDS